MALCSRCSVHEQCVEGCHDIQEEDFKKVVTLRNSGLLIYIHKKQTIPEKPSIRKVYETIVLFNPTDSDVKRPVYMKELSLYKTKCLQCRVQIQRVRSLLNEIRNIRKSETVAVCEYCKRQCINPCKRCLYIINKFKNSEAKQLEENEEKFKLWASKVKLFLQSILQKGATCSHGTIGGIISTKELEMLLRELKSSVQFRQPEIEIFPMLEKLTSSKDLTTSAELLKDILITIKAKNKDYITSEENAGSFSSSSSCVCTHVAEKLLEKKSKQLTTNADLRAHAAPTPRTSLASDIMTTEEKDLLKTIAQDKVLKQTPETIGKENIPITGKKEFKSADKKRQEEEGDKSEKLNQKDRTESSKKKKQAEEDIAPSTKKKQMPDDYNFVKNKDKKNTVSANTKKQMGGEIPRNRNQKGETTPSTKKKEVQNESSGRKMQKEKSDSPKNKSQTEKDEIYRTKSSKTDIIPLSKIKQMQDNEISKKEKEKLRTESFKKKNETENDEFLEKVPKNIIDKSMIEETTSFKNRKQTKDKEQRLKEQKVNNQGNVIPKRKAHSAFELLDSQVISNTPKTKGKQYIGVKQTKSDTQIRSKIHTFENLRELTQLKKESSDSVVERFVKQGSTKKMIKGEKIVPFNPHYKDDDTVSLKPILFNLQADFLISDPIPETSPARSSIQPKEETTPDKPKNEGNYKGFVYQLSNRLFIEKGWTKLPATKVMRKMNIYRMKAASPQCNWFTRNIRKELLFYPTGEKFAEINKDGFGKWYYKNGNVALDYYQPQEANVDYRCIVYSDGESTEFGKSAPITVLGAFDSLGNAVVYGMNGRERIKYNQTEGIVFDKKIAAVHRWKWHTLNDPPVLKPMYVDNYVKHGQLCLKQVIDQRDDKSLSIDKTSNDEAMLAIEFENFLKEKADKLMQKFKPFQIQTKVVKINSQFSLRIFDQANVTLMFNDGNTTARFPLGVLLISNEILDTEMVEMANVDTPYDRIIPKTESVANIRRIIADVQSKEINSDSSDAI